MKIKKLKWHIMEGHFGSGFLAMISGFNTNYCIYYDRHSFTWKVSGIDRKKTDHNNPDEAKDWCQKDYEEKLKSLLYT